MKTPQTLGRYRILGEISRGAMGRVYLAHDPHIDRRVAIKTIHPVEGLSPSDAAEYRLRFLREAQAAGRLQNPGIVTIYDVGVHEGTSFIAMEYIEGETLEAFTRPGSLLPVENVIDLMAQACDALDYAHQQKVVHRDIKPANLMLKNGQLKITDFGLAKNPATSLTQDGTLMGTPNYMSPEQILGRPVDGRSDLFSLGAVLYELVTGDRPFSGETVTTIMYRIVHEPPQPLRNLATGLPDVVQRAITKSLEKDPANRFQTGEEFASLLRGRKAAAMSIGSTQPMEVIEAPDELLELDEESEPEAKRPAHAVAPEPAPQVAPQRPVATSVAAQPQRTPAVQRPSAGRVALSEEVERPGWLRRRWARFGFVGLVATGILALLPTSITLDDRWGRGSDDGSPPFYSTAAIIAGGVPPLAPAPSRPTPSGSSDGSRPAPLSQEQQPPALPAAAIPGEAPKVGVALASDPPGARFYLDDREIAGGDLYLPADDKAKHTIVAENDCFIETIEFSLDARRRLTVPMRTPKVTQVSITSEPAGAQILLDGKGTRSVTPAEIPVPLCGKHAVSLKREGYLDASRTVDDPGKPLSVTLKPIPKGYLEVTAPYPVTLFEGSAKIGTNGQRIQLTAGEHTIRMVNADLFVDRPILVTVKADATTRPDAGLPGTGTLTVLASPGNCTIFVQDREVGAPPINDLPLAAGSYKIRAVYLPTGESQEATVTITAGGNKRVPFRFNP